MRKTAVISFIGTGRARADGGTGYEEATYQFDDRARYTTPLFATAVVNWLRKEKGEDVDDWFVFGSPQSNWGDLIEVLPAGSYAELVDGRHQLNEAPENSQAEVAAFAEALQAHARLAIHPQVIVGLGQGIESQHRILDLLLHVPDGCDLVLDITHGFRHLPVIVALAVPMLRHAKKLASIRCFYGMFEAKDERGVTPVVELPIVNDIVFATEAVATAKHTLNLGPISRAFFGNEDSASAMALRLVDGLALNIPVNESEISDVQALGTSKELKDWQRDLWEQSTRFLTAMKGETTHERLRARAELARGRRQFSLAISLLFEALNELAFFVANQRGTDLLEERFETSQVLKNYFIEWNDAENGAVYTRLRYARNIVTHASGLEWDELEAGTNAWMNETLAEILGQRDPAQILRDASGLYQALPKLLDNKDWRKRASAEQIGRNLAAARGGR